LARNIPTKLLIVSKRMLIFEEEKRPNFIELGKMVFNETYVPRIDRVLSELTKPVKSKENSSSSQKDGNSKKDKTDEEKMYLFREYVEKHKLRFNMNKITYWFEYGGNMIAKYYSNKENSKWKLTAKYKSEFPSHFVMIYIDEDIGHLLLGGIDNQNTFQYRDTQIIKKNSMNIDRSFMAVCHVSGKIFAIGGYEYNEKVQLKSIEVYHIESDKWEANVYEDLKIGRSQANALVFNNDILVFGGYNKNFGTLNSIEKVSLKNKTTDLLDLKLPIPLRRSAALKISNNQCIIFGGISRLCKESDAVYCLNLDGNSFTQFSPLPRAGIIEHEILVDEKGTLHLFFENNYGTSPPIHMTYNYLDFS